MKKILKKISVVSLLIFFIFSCKTENKKEAINAVNSNIEKNIVQNKKIKIELLKLDYDDLPDQIKPSGDFVLATKWSDIKGDNYLVIYRVGPNSETEFLESDDEKYAEFYIKQYVFQNGSYSELWKTIDFVRNCSYDLWIGLSSEKSFYVTDLNDNGISETSFVYYLSCRSDTSPSEMKLIMREGNQKFALRGTSILKPYLIDINLENFEPKLDKSLIGNDDGSTSFLLKTMGRYISDEDFSNNPKMLKFAREKWLENMIEKNMKQL
jgi:hypothetical protein